MKVKNVLEKYGNYIREIARNKDRSGGVWIYLKYPWYNYKTDGRSINAKTLTEAVRVLNEIIDTNSTQYTEPNQINIIPEQQQGGKP